jgi:hypothetical protein
VYDVANGLINFGYNGSAGGGVAAPQYGWLNLPNSTLSTGDLPYTYSGRHGPLNNQSCLLSGGTSGGNQAFSLTAYYTSSTASYFTSWYGVSMNGGTGVGTYAPNTVVTTTYATGGTNAVLRYGGTAYPWNPGSVHTMTANNHTIGQLNASGWTNMVGTTTLYNMYLYNTVLPGTDIGLVENTPYAAPVVVPTVFAIGSSTSGTTVTVTWTAIPAVATYTFFVSNYPVATGVVNTGGALATYALTGLATNLQPYVVSMNGYNAMGVLTYSGVVDVPSALVLSSSYSSGTGKVTLTWTGGAGIGVTTSYTSSSTGAPTGPTAITSGTQLSVTGSGPWIFTVTASNASGTASADTTASPIKITVTSINTQSGDVVGTASNAGINYNVYVLKSTAVTYTLGYTCNSTCNVSVLAVAGGGAAGSGGNYGGGGGGGGVAMASVPFVAQASTITIKVGAGGVGTGYLAAFTSQNGAPTTLTFNGQTAYNISATGGGSGASGNYTSSPGNNGGSGGGGGGGGEGRAAGSRISGGSGTSSSNAWVTYYGNRGGNGGDSTVSKSGGGGGAGGQGGDVNGDGGTGIQCTLPGIAQFTPLTTAYGTYYWAGGGGGCGDYLGSGGKGGGGGGNGTNPDTGYAINNATAQNGAPATGGGGGGWWYGGTNGSGGSGIVIIALPS